MSKLECVVSDLDASLLGSDKKISAKDLETIKLLKKKGIYFFIVTGRHPDFVRELAWVTGLDFPAVCCNGALIYDFEKNEPIMSQPIPNKIAAEVKKYLDEHKREYIIYTPYTPYFTAGNPRIPHWKKVSQESEGRNRFEIHVLDDNYDIYKEDTIKFLIPEADQSAFDELNANLNADGSLSMVFSGEGLLDVNAADTSKGSAVKYLSEKYSFSLENTICLGDNFNDTSMLEICGMPVSPENGEDDVKAIAKYITTHHDNNPLTNAVKALFPELLAD